MKDTIIHILTDQPCVWWYITLYLCSAYGRIMNKTKLQRKKKVMEQDTDEEDPLFLGGIK